MFIIHNCKDKKQSRKAKKGLKIMTVNYTEYMEELTKFLRKHNAKGECKIYTSPMENNRYHKEYCWEDGAMWSEITELITEEKEVQAHGLVFKVQVEMWITEFYSTESGSKYYYCK
jgi:hypothetical protein